MNFSEWDRYDAKKREEKREEVWEAVEESELPLWYYLLLHPEARLDEADEMLLREWSNGGS